MAHAAREIARREGLNEEGLVIGGRLQGRSGTETARQMIAERLLYQRQYYEKVLGQMECSEAMEK